MFDTKLRIANLLFLTAVILTFFITGCKKDDDGTEQEVITRVVVHLTGSGLDKEFEAKDPDGDGIWNSIDTIVLPAHSGFYTCHLHVYDDTKNPVEDITEEIEEENTKHLFVFTNNLNGLLIADLDLDDNGQTFGLESSWATTVPSAGPLQIQLIHEPTDKNNVLDPGGEVDFDVSFLVIIQ